MYLDKAISCDKDCSEYYRELSRVYYKRNEMEKAQIYFEKLIELEPDNEWAYSNLGNIYFYHLGNFDVAYQYYNKAYELNSAYCWAAYNLANMKMIYKSFDEAIDLYSQACSLAPMNPLFFNALGNAYLKTKEIEKSIECWENSILIDENNEDANLSLAEIYLNEKKDYEKARSYFEKVKTLNPNNSMAYYGLAKISFFDFDKNNAIINIDIAIELENDNDKFKAFRNRIDEELKYE